MSRVGVTGLRPCYCGAPLRLGRTVRALLAAAAIAPAWGEAAPLRFAEDPPPGFETLTERQTAKIDVYFAERRIASVLARFDLTQVEIIDRDALLKALPALKERSAIEAALSSAMPTHADKVCGVHPKPGCGALQSDDIALILDAERFRADLFINPALLATDDGEANAHLPNPDTSPSAFGRWRQRVVSDGEIHKWRSTLDSTLARGRTRLESRLTLETHASATVDRSVLVYQGDHQEWQAGKLTSAGELVSLLNANDFLGLRLSSSLRTRKNLSSLEATPLEVFLPQRSRVEVYKDDELLTSRLLPAGPHRLDTSALPAGTYWVTVRITNASGERRETHLFSRTALLAPTNQPQYQVALGQLRNGHDSTDETDFVNLGGRFRLTRNPGLEAGHVHAMEKEHSTHAAVYSLFSGGFGYAGLTHATAQGLGGVAGLLVQAGDFGATLTLRNTGRAREVATSRENSARSLLLRQQYADLGLHASLAGGQLRVRGVWERRDDGSDEIQHALGFRRELWRNASSTLTFSADYRQTPAESAWMVSLSLHAANESGSYSAGINAPRAGATDEPDLSTDLQGTYVHDSTPGQTLTASAFAMLGRNARDIGLAMAYEAEQLRGYFDIQQSERQDGARPSLSAETETVFLISGAGIALGDGQGGNAGVVVEIDAPPSGHFEILVGGQKIATVTGSGRKAIPLQPFRSYEVTLKPIGDAFLDIDTAPRQITVFPGNIVRLHWEAKPLQVVTLRAVGTDGQPLGNARVTNLKEFAATDDNGWLQVEISGQQHIVLSPPRGPACRLALPALDAPGNKPITLGKLTCQPVED